MYLLTPLLFWVASRTFLFKNANGPLYSNIHNLFKNLDYQSYFKKDFPFPSLLAIVAGSLVAIYAGGALGPETPIIYMSMLLLLYAYNLFKCVFKNYSLELNFESLLYLGYIFGITILFHSPLASLVLVLEKSIRDGSANIASNVIYCCVGILVAYSLVDISNNLFQDPPVSFSYNVSHTIQYLILAIICGLLASILMAIMTSLFYGVNSLVNKSKVLLNILPIIFGFCVAALINTSEHGDEITGSGIKLLNCEFYDTCVYNFKILFGIIMNVILTFIAGCPGGQKFIFMSIGGGIGSVYDNYTSVPHTQSIIVGITAFFSTIFGNPIASAFIILKTANLPYETLPMLLSISLVAYYAFKYSNAYLE
jgi:H+/Cl- antiporter ClcA